MQYASQLKTGKKPILSVNKLYWVHLNNGRKRWMIYVVNPSVLLKQNKIDYFVLYMEWSTLYTSHKTSACHFLFFQNDISSIKIYSYIRSISTRYINIFSVIVIQCKYHPVPLKENFSTLLLDFPVLNSSLSTYKLQRPLCIGPFNGPSSILMSLAHGTWKKVSFGLEPGLW